MNEVVALRREAGLTQQELAGRSRAAQPNISAYECGRRTPSSTMPHRLRSAARSLPHEVVAVKRGELIETAWPHGLCDVRIFGSALRGDDKAGSDVELLVTPPARAGLLGVAAFAADVEKLLGLPVDVVSSGGRGEGHPILTEAKPM